MSNPEQPAASQNNANGPANDRNVLRQRLIESATSILEFTRTTNNNRNQQPQQQLITIRDQLFHSIFYRFAVMYCKIVPSSIRRLIEFVLLIEALVAFFTLIYIHVTLAKTSTTCLKSVAGTWPRDGILQVAVVGHDGDDNQYDLGEDKILITWGDTDDGVSNTAKQLIGKNTSAEDSESIFLTVEKQYDNETIVTSETSIFEQYPLLSTLYYIILQFPYIQISKERKNERSHYLPSLSTFDHKRLMEDYYNEKNNDNEQLATGQSFPKLRYLVEYSLEYGYLRLHPYTRKKLNIPVMTIILHANNEKCFGDDFSQFILKYLLGYNDILMASVKKLSEKQEYRGYFRNVISGEHYKFIDIWMSRISYLPAICFMLLFTAVVSMLLRYAHYQVFVFIVDVLQMLEFNVATSFPTSALITAILALIGTEVIMSEFFNDSVTAFYVIVLVWLANQYDTICCSTPITKRHWLRFFYLYHFLFYAYHYRFNGQYSLLVLIASWMFMQHSMVYFFHHYELPTIRYQNRLQQLMYVRTATLADGVLRDADVTGNLIDVAEQNLRRERLANVTIGEDINRTPRPNVQQQQRPITFNLNFRSAQSGLHSLRNTLSLSNLNSPRVRRLISIFPNRSRSAESISTNGIPPEGNSPPSVE